MYAFPKRAYTFCLRHFVDSEISRRAIPWFIRHYNVELREIAKDLSDYRTLGEFFTRQLRLGARPIEDGITSPTDGLVQEVGGLEGGRRLFVKGSLFNLRQLVQDDDLAEELLGGQSVTVYLSPRDYHRIHAPVECAPEQVWRIPGSLYPVNPAATRVMPGLLARNERVVTRFSSPWGPFVMVMVGACGVGTIRLRYAVNRGRQLNLIPGQAYRRGEEIGHFALGSTVLVLFPSSWALEWSVAVGDHVRMGQNLAKIAMDRKG
ncbi:archaetidylserine decarboxylase [Alicyclobacillus sendaiensis]|uniref:phosphatidylserine decarboxylase n=1 Tax=Alicyclobacillus sendaiensis PA2 TaxID=3029425 RepID=A0ABT6XXZ3_ALISE|nr:archaetidylserine decarboxylase [Alicyclobacillus sendaiensis]MDI9259959.1 archaetidylserine decarboxylase [Alicyclobacillus sendaiensis PA2]